jgi:hypothetical protein
MPFLLSINASEIMLVDNDDYQPDCPWKTSDFDDDEETRHTLNRGVSVGNNYDLDKGEFKGV